MNGKIIVAKDGIKREIEFPFEICLSKLDARWLRAQLKQMEGDDASYGWIMIPRQADEQGKANTTPLKWSDR